MSVKQRLKSLFQARSGSEYAVELAQRFLIPFMRYYNKQSLDESLADFFALNQRKIFYAKATRSFQLPGKYLVAGNRPIQGVGSQEIRNIKLGKVLLIVLDSVDQTAKVEIVVNDQSHCFLLERFEFETIKDWIKIIAD